MIIRNTLIALSTASLLLACGGETMPEPETAVDETAEAPEEEAPAEEAAEEGAEEGSRRRSLRQSH